jgi:hypothetical protein
VSHCKLACSWAFWLVAYPAQSHEMLFDAHTRSFEAFGGIGLDRDVPAALTEPFINKETDASAAVSFAA